MTDAQQTQLEERIALAMGTKFRDDVYQLVGELMREARAQRELVRVAEAKAYKAAESMRWRSIDAAKCSVPAEDIYKHDLAVKAIKALTTFEE